MTDVNADFYDWLDQNGGALVSSAATDKFVAWLDSSSALRCMLVECAWVNPSTGASGLECMATMPFASSPADIPANRVYRAVVRAIPSFSQVMSDFLYGATQANVASLELFAGDDSMDLWLDGTRDFIGRAVTIYLGDPTWDKSEFRSIWSGVIASVTVRGTNTVVLEVRDWQHLLNQPIDRKLFNDVYGFFRGPNLNSPYPLSFGQCKRVKPAYFPFSVSPEVSQHTYFIHDGAVQAIDVVYSQGYPLAANQWTGYPELGYFTVSTDALAQTTITADVRGQMSPNGKLLETPAEIIGQIIARSGLATLRTDWSGISSKCSQRIELYTGQEPITPAQVLDAIMTSIGGYYAIGRDGTLYGGRVDFDDDPVMEIGVDQIVLNGLSVEKILQPRASYTLAYDRFGKVDKFLPPYYAYVGWSASIDAETRAWLEKGYRLARAENPNIANLAKVTREDVRPTLFWTFDEASAEAARLIALFGTLRLIVSCECFLAPARIELGDTVKITHPRFGFAIGRKGVVVGIAERPSMRRVTLKVLVQ